MSKPDPGNPLAKKYGGQHIPEKWNMRTVKGFAKAIKTNLNCLYVCLTAVSLVWQACLSDKTSILSVPQGSISSLRWLIFQGCEMSLFW